MAIGLSAQQIPPSLPIDFLRKVEQLRRANPALLDQIEQSNGFRFPSENITSPTRAPMQRIRARRPMRLTLRSPGTFASFKTEEEVEAKAKIALAVKQTKKTAWKGPKSPVLTLFALKKKMEQASFGGGGPALEAAPVEVEVPELEDTRFTEDDMRRVTEDAMVRILE